MHLLRSVAATPCRSIRFGSLHPRWTTHPLEDVRTAGYIVARLVVVGKDGAILAPDASQTKFARFAEGSNGVIFDTTIGIPVTLNHLQYGSPHALDVVLLGSLTLLQMVHPSP